MVGRGELRKPSQSPECLSLGKKLTQHNPLMSQVRSLLFCKLNQGRSQGHKVELNVSDSLVSIAL